MRYRRPMSSVARIPPPPRATDMRQRRRRLPSLAAAILAVLTSASLASPASAAPTPATESAQAGTCAAGDFCIWRYRNYTGTIGVIIDQPNGSCPWKLDKQSYINNTGIEGYFYSGANCTGRVKPVTHNSRGNIGFVARSFKHACVSCRTTDE
ncbi:MAG: hypothetical protein GEV10_00820 [Streptosporangiales bacterium]|nr:hypothetical protein [Streptosporangiales bacterium]